jgi:hypothetical protein
MWDETFCTHCVPTEGINLLTVRQLCRSTCPESFFLTKGKLLPLSCLESRNTSDETWGAIFQYSRQDRAEPLGSPAGDMLEDRSSKRNVVNPGVIDEQNTQP